MADRVKKQEIAEALALRMNVSEKEAGLWLDAVTETLYEAIASGHSVTLPGLGGFYVKTRSTATWTFKFNPSQRLRSALGWSSTYAGD
jgi:DNA-binding protein HU-beta